MATATTLAGLDELRAQLRGEIITPDPRLSERRSRADFQRSFYREYKGLDYEVMKGPDHVEIGEAEGIVGVHDGCRDELRAGWRIATEQR